MQIIIWILGGIAAYLLWGKVTWLSVLVVLLAISFSVHPDDQQEQNKTGMFSTPTATRLMWTFVAVVAILIYSLFV